MPPGLHWSATVRGECLPLSDAGRVAWTLVCLVSQRASCLHGRTPAILAPNLDCAQPREFGHAVFQTSPKRERGKFAFRPSLALRANIRLCAIRADAVLPYLIHKHGHLFTHGFHQDRRRFGCGV